MTKRFYRERQFCREVVIAIRKRLPLGDSAAGLTMAGGIALPRSLLRCSRNLSTPVFLKALQIADAPLPHAPPRLSQSTRHAVRQSRGSSSSSPLPDSSTPVVVTRALDKNAKTQWASQQNLIFPSGPLVQSLVKKLTQNCGVARSTVSRKPHTSRMSRHFFVSHIS